MFGFRSGFFFLDFLGQGCENGVFGKRCFCPLPKTGDFDEKWRKLQFTFYPQKQGVALVRARKATKMTKMAGVPQTKPGFAKNRVFATLTWKTSRENPLKNPRLSRELLDQNPPREISALRLGSSIGRTPRGSCNRTLLRRVLRRFFKGSAFLEGFLEGAL